MKTVKQLIAEVAQLINDAEEGYEHIRWTENELIEYANDAVLQLMVVRPDVFTKVVDLPLKPGSQQELPEPISQLIDVLGVRDVFGRVSGRPMRKNAAAAAVARNWFDELSCEVTAADGSYVPRSYEFAPENPRMFYVEPPVPSGASVTLIVNAVVTPKHAELDDKLPIESRFHNAVIEWMLYRAYSKDIESAHDNQTSQQHLAHFYNILQVSQLADDRLHGITNRGSRNVT